MHFKHLDAKGRQTTGYNLRANPGDTAPLGIPQPGLVAGTGERALSDSNISRTGACRKVISDTP